MNNIESIFKNVEYHSLLNTFEHSIEPIVITDANWEDGLKILYSNKIFCKETGYLQEELLGENPKIFQGNLSNYKTLAKLKVELQEGKNFTGQSVNYRKDGSYFHVKWSISPLKDKENNVIAYISFQKVLNNNFFIEETKLLSSIVQESNNMILVTDLNGVIVYANKSFNEHLGYKDDELIGQHSRVLKSGQQEDSFYKKMWYSVIRNGSFSGTFISKKKDGTFFYDKKHISTIKDEDKRAIYYVSISSDITKQKELEEKLTQEVYLDQLTDTYNRKKYDMVLANKIEHYKDEKMIFTLILLDIDHFKNINDTYGHEMGDFILIELSNLIKENIRDSDILFRWGGEEFALLVDLDIDISFKLAQKLKNIIQEFLFQSINITASFGIAQIDENIDAKELFNKADDALYKAKHQGRNKVIKG